MGSAQTVSQSAEVFCKTFCDCSQILNDLYGLPPKITNAVLVGFIFIAFIFQRTCKKPFSGFLDIRFCFKLIQCMIRTKRITQGSVWVYTLPMPVPSAKPLVVWPSVILL